MPAFLTMSAVLFLWEEILQNRNGSSADRCLRGRVQKQLHLADIPPLASLRYLPLRVKMRDLIFRACPHLLKAPSLYPEASDQPNDAILYAHCAGGMA